MTQSESRTGSMQLPRWGSVNIPHWQRIGPPLRPGPDDIGAYGQEVAAWSEANGGRAALACVFGVTPELAALRWPAGSRAFAVDHSAEMLHQAWYWGAPAAGGAIAADWRRLPVRPGSVDLVLGDGIMAFFSWPSEQLALLEETADILRPGGRLLLRMFLRPGTPETVEEVVADLLADRIGTFTVFKWRLVAAVHGAGDSVLVSDVWKAWQAAGLREPDVAERFGCPLSVVQAIRAYGRLDVRYTLPTPEQFEETLRAQPWFNMLGCHAFTYELGERFRLVVLEKR